MPALFVALLASLVASGVRAQIDQCNPDTFTVRGGAGGVLLAVNTSGLWACGQTELCSALASTQERVTGACNSTAVVRVVNADGTVACSTVPQGDVTGVTAGAGLTGGGSVGDVTLSADTDFLQRRLASNCTAAGAQAVAAVGPDGTVTCVAVPQGDVTAVSAGVGLTGGGNSGNVTLSADTSYLQRRVSGTCTANAQVMTGVAQDGTVTCASAPGGDITGVSAGSGLAGGGTSGAVTLNVDTSATGVVEPKLPIETLLFRGILHLNEANGGCDCIGTRCAGVQCETCAIGNTCGTSGATCPSTHLCLIFNALSDARFSGVPSWNFVSSEYHAEWSASGNSAALPFTPYMSTDVNKIVFHVGDISGSSGDVSLDIWNFA